MSSNESHSPGYEAERTPSPPPLPPLPDAHLVLPITSTPLAVPPLLTPPASASPDHIVLSLDDDSSATSDDDIEPGSPLPPPTSPLPPDDHRSLASPPFLPANNRTWATLPTPLLVSSVLASPATPDSAPQQSERDEDRDGRYVTHRPLPIHTTAAGGQSTAKHHSLNPPHSDYSAASTSPGGLSPAVGGGSEEKQQQQSLRDDTLDAHMLKTPTSDGGEEAEETAAAGVEVVTVQVAEASDEEDDVKATEDRDGSPLDDSTMRYGTAGSDMQLTLSAVEAAPDEGEREEEEEKEAKQEDELNHSHESFHYTPHGHHSSHDSLHILTTGATAELGDTLGTFHTLSVPSRISDTTVPYQTMSHVSRISDTTVPYTATSGDGSGVTAEYQYTYGAEQEGLMEQGRLSSNPLSPSPASPSYHALNSPRSPTTSHPLAYHTIHSPTSPSAPYQHTVSSMGPVSYSAAQLRPFSPSLLADDSNIRQEYKTGEADVNSTEGAVAVAGEHAPGGVAVLVDDEKEPGEAVEPEVLAAIARLEAGEHAESDVVRVSIGELDNSSAILPAHQAGEMELQRYGSGLPAAFASAAVVAVGGGMAVDDGGGEGVNMRKEGQTTPIRASVNRSSRAAAASSKLKSANQRSSRSSRHRPAAVKSAVVRWPIFSSFFITAVVIVFVLEMQYEDWKWDELYTNPMFGPHPGTLLHFGARFTPAILLHNQHWRLIASILIHSGAIHCLFSLVIGCMYAYQFEREHGWWRVAVCWLVSGLFGQLFSSLLSPTFVSVGGSAAVAGLVSGWVGDWLHSWNRIDNHWSYASRHAFCMCIVFTAGVFPYNDNYAALGACMCGMACGLILYCPIHKKTDARWQLGDVGRWRITGIRKVLLGVVLLCAMYGVVCGLLFGRSVDELYGCVNCHWVGCVDTPLWSCSAGVPSDCFDSTGHLTHKSTSPYC